MKRIARLAIAAVLVAIPLGAGNAAAALILYEGFGDYAPGNVVGKAIGASTVGLDKTTNWESNNAIGWHVVPTGLTVGSGSTTLQTAAGAVVKQSGSTVLAGRLDVDNYVGTFYASYLYSVDLSSAGTSVPNQGVFAVIGEGVLNNANRHFRQMARYTNTTTSPVGVNYSSGTQNGSGQLNTPEETYMILSRFTRVGETVNAATPGVATLWALTSSQFDHFKSNGFAGIDAAGVGAASTQVTGKATHTHSPAADEIYTLNDSWHLQLASAQASSVYLIFDEIRMGSSFDDVTPVIPEPTTAMLAVVAACGLGALRRRR